jgi:hypothetical protein
MVALLVTVSSLTSVTAKAATTPVISYVGLGHALVAGDTRTFTATSANYTGQVQYRAFISYENHAKWTEVTTGYTAATNAKTAFVLPASGKFGIGHYKLSVWVKAANTTGTIKTTLGAYDSYKVSALNCTTSIGAQIAKVVAPTTALVAGDTAKVTATSTFAGQVQYRAFILQNATGKVYAPLSAAYSVAVKGTTPYVLPATAALEAGTYTVSVWVKRAGETGVKTSALGSYDNYKTVTLTVAANTGIVKIFDTTAVAANYGSTVNVKMTIAGTTNFPTATQYQVFNGTAPVSNPTTLGTETTVYPTPVAGTKVTVKLLDVNAIAVKSIDVVLGQSGTITVVPPVVVPPTQATTTATILTAHANQFGQNIAVTTTLKDVTNYQILVSGSAISAKTKLADSTLVNGVKAGDKVTINLINATGTVIGTNDVTLVAAK